MAFFLLLIFNDLLAVVLIEGNRPLIYDQTTGGAPAPDIYINRFILAFLNFAQLLLASKPI